jgi:hypothetical protein
LAPGGVVAPLDGAGHAGHDTNIRPKQVRANAEESPMTYAFTYDVPINAETYDRIKQGLGPERPPGLIAHLAWRTESGLRYVDVWQSKDEWESFTENRLHPVVHPILQDTLGFVPPEPPRTVLDVIDAWTDRHPS